MEEQKEQQKDHIDIGEFFMEKRCVKQLFVAVVMGEIFKYYCVVTNQKYKKMHIIVQNHKY